MLCIDNRDAALESEKIAFDPKVLNDNFKAINDTFGHQYGNEVLVEMAGIFSNQFRSGDIVGRFGGDEFLAFLPNTRGFERMEYVFQRLVKECDRNYEKDGVVINVSASFGIAVAPDHGVTYEELSQKADEMLLAVKRRIRKGIGCISKYLQIRSYKKETRECFTDFLYSILGFLYGGFNMYRN